MHQSMCSESRRRHRDAASEIRGGFKQGRTNATGSADSQRQEQRTQAGTGTDTAETHEGMKVQEVMKALDVSEEMVYRARQRFVEEGLDAALHDKPRPGQKLKLNDRQCAHVIALACSDAPAGHDHWTLRLLADKVVALGFAESISHETVRSVLKKTTSSRGKVNNGAYRK